MPDPGGSPDPLADVRLAPLWWAAHRRLEAVGAEGLVAGATVSLRDLEPDQRGAVDRLLGVRSRGVIVRVPLHRLDALLRERVGRSLSTVLIERVGPLRDRPSERSAAAAAEAASWARLGRHPALGAHPWLASWLANVRRRWSEDDLYDALDVLGRLPQAVRVGRTRLAARALHDAHAFDDDRAVGRLLLSALAHRGGLPVAQLRAADRRRLWAEQGVLSDETSSTVLTLGLRPVPAGPLTEAARRWADAGLPLPIPLAAVQAEDWALPAGTLVSVCENPSVLAAAAGSGTTVVCVEGRPRLAGTLLLRALVEGGARLRYHGDFGAGGISIANGVIGRLGAAPWRLGADDYREALARAGDAVLRPLRGPVPDACWDSALAPLVRGAGVEIEEELVIDLLLGDLEAG